MIGINNIGRELTDGAEERVDGSLAAIVDVGGEAKDGGLDGLRHGFGGRHCLPERWR